MFSPEKNDIPTKEETTKTKDLSYEKPQEGVIVAGAEKIVLFSYNESTTGGTINLGGNYGMTQFTLVDDVMKKTSPMVRGDKLKDFLQEMMDFVGSHTHSCPGMAPDKNGTNSKKTDKDNIQKKLEEFDDKVLNQNLRIN